MKFDQDHRSDDVIDRRGRGGGGVSGAGIFALVPLLVRSPLGVGGALVVVALVVGVRGGVRHEAQPDGGLLESIGHGGTSRS